MKKIILALVLVCGMFCLAQAPAPIEATTNITLETGIEIYEFGKWVQEGVKEIGWGQFVAANWYVLIMSLFGLVGIVVFLTPTKKDDEVFKKVFGPFIDFMPNIYKGVGGIVTGILKKKLPTKPPKDS